MNRRPRTDGGMWGRGMARLVALCVLLAPYGTHAARRGSKAHPTVATVAAADRVWQAVAKAARFWSQGDRDAVRNQQGLTRTTTDNITYEALSPGRKQVGRVTANIGDEARLSVAVSYGTRAAEGQLLRMMVKTTAGTAEATFNGKTVRMRASDGNGTSLVPVNTYAGRERIAHVNGSLPSYASLLGNRLPVSVLLPVQALIERVPRRDRDVFEAMLAPFMSAK